MCRHGKRLRHPAFACSIAQDLAAKLRRSTNSLFSASLCPAESRLCHYLLCEAQSGVYRGTLTQAASAIGVSNRHLFRLFDALCRQGMIRKEADAYVISDLENMRRCGYAAQEEICSTN